jgi:hypothetical protein
MSESFWWKICSIDNGSEFSSKNNENDLDLIGYVRGSIEEISKVSLRVFYGSVKISKLKPYEFREIKEKFNIEDEDVGFFLNLHDAKRVYANLPSIKKLENLS